MTYNCSSSTVCNAGPLGPSLTEVCSDPAVLLFMSLVNSMVRSNEKISGQCERIKPVETPIKQYDFVVVGGGTAGAVVVGRLSELPDLQVLLLEAGPDEPAATEVPGYSSLYKNTKNSWNYKTTNERNACLSTNGSCDWSSAKMLGGNSAINGMIYTRGNSRDYNEWAEAGNEGWTWEEVERYFLKAEDNGEIERVGRQHHATGGPLPVERFPYVPPIGESILKAAVEAGFGVSEDLNGDVKTGFSRIQAMNKQGVRHSSSRSYLWPNRNRKNLHVSVKSHVTKVMIKNHTAVGVEYYKNGKKRTVFATKEVIVSAGVVGSPHLLMLSGIGPKDHLESKGIKVVLDAPGVGKNLHDHPCAILSYTINEPDEYDNSWKATVEYLSNQTGSPSAIGSVQLVAMMTTSKTKFGNPDIEIYINGYLSNCAPGPVGARQSSEKRLLRLTPSVVRPKSRGTVTLNSSNPYENPIINANYYAEREDLERMLEGIRMCLDLVDTDALSRYKFTLLPVPACSGYKFDSDEYWICVARQENFALYHQGGTCKMGPSSDPMAVVDPRLRVHGIKRLRVVDNSIMPQVPSSNTAAPAIMIGEHAADMIKEDWTHPRTKGR